MDSWTSYMKFWNWTLPFTLSYIWIISYYCECSGHNFDLLMASPEIGRTVMNCDTILACHSYLWYVKFITWWWFLTAIIRRNGYHPQAATCVYVNMYIYISQRLCKYVYKGDTAIIRLIIQSSLFCQCNCTYRSVLIRSIPYWDMYIHAWS